MMNPIFSALLLFGAYGMATAGRYYVRKFDKIPFWVLMILAFFIEIFVFVAVVVVWTEIKR